MHKGSSVKQLIISSSCWFFTFLSLRQYIAPLRSYWRSIIFTILHLQLTGVHIFFDNKPHGIPKDRIAQAFFQRKLRYAVNAMVIGCPDRLIYDLNLASLGSISDSTTWRCYRVKMILEGLHPKFLVAGYSGYSKSRIMVKPFTDYTWQRSCRWEGT